MTTSKVRPKKRGLQPDAGLRERVRELTQERSQAEIARSTGVDESSVSRFLTGARMPAEFLISLVREFGVSPAWLLTGEESKWRAEVNESAQSAATELLELVRAMNAVSEMRLGAIASGRPFRLLRELMNATRQYESLRERMNERSAPILASILERFRETLNRGDHDSAQELCETAEQLARFCDDTPQLLDLATLHIRLAASQYDLPRALEQTRRVIKLALLAGGSLSEREFEVLVESVRALQNWSRTAEALRVAKAANALADEATQQCEAAYWLQAIVGHMQVHTGNLRDGLSALAGVRGRLTEQRRRETDAYFVRALLLSGAMSVEEAVRTGEDSVEKAELILGFACFLGEAIALNYASDYHDRIVPRSNYRAAHRLYLRALQGETRGLVEEIEAMREERPHPAFGFSFAPIIAGEIYHAMDHQQALRNCVREFVRIEAEFPGWFGFSTLWQARHKRLVLVAGTRQQRREAREFFQRHVDAGYQSFAPTLEQCDE